MEQGPGDVRWRGEEFRFEYPAAGNTPAWAASRHGEFIGIISYPSLLHLPRDSSPEFTAGWRAAVLKATEHAFGVGTPEMEALERLANEVSGAHRNPPR
jgi:hypothetical protein